MALWGKLDNLASVPKFIAQSKTFTANSTMVSTTAETITIAEHGFATGDRVLYLNGGGTAPTGLTSNTAYFVISANENAVKLATTLANALAGTAIDLSGVGAGSAHTLQKAPSAIFVDTNEAAVVSNRNVGLHTPGWNLYETRTDSGGNTRRRVETLVPMKVANTTATDAGVLGTGDIAANT